VCRFFGVVERKADISIAASGDRHMLLKVGAAVFYRNKDKKTEGEGILCSITAVLGEGKQKRYVYRGNLVRNMQLMNMQVRDTRCRSRTR